MTCLITGCVATNGVEWVGGDLHQIGNCYAFNACIGLNKEAAWSTREDFAHYSEKEIDFSMANGYWERRGTLIAPVSECVLNDAAKEYIK